MPNPEKTVFISYRRTNLPWAIALYKDLTANGYDVFFDFQSIDSGSFERIILNNIASRAHFIVLLTPSALERCHEPGDWLRREIEYAIELKRNIVPLTFEGFDFGNPGIKKYLTGKLAALKDYNALRVPADYFDEAMAKLRNRHLNVPLEDVLHPASAEAQQAAADQRAAIAQEPDVTERTLTAGEWFEKGFASNDMQEKVRCYTEAIRLKPDDAEAYNNRGVAYGKLGDRDREIADYEAALRIDPNHKLVRENLEIARRQKARGE